MELSIDLFLNTEIIVSFIICLFCTFMILFFINKDLKNKDQKIQLDRLEVCNKIELIKLKIKEENTSIDQLKQILLKVNQEYIMQSEKIQTQTQKLIDSNYKQLDDNINSYSQEIKKQTQSQFEHNDFQQIADICLHKVGEIHD